MKEKVKEIFNKIKKKKKEKLNRPKKTMQQIILDNVYSLGIAFCIAILIRSFLVQAFFIPSGSMKPNLLEGDYVFVTKYNYGYSNYALPFGIPLLPKNRIFYKEPKRGDVVIFKYPENTSIDYVKRLIGLPGDTIQIINSIVYINNKPLERTFIETIVVDGFNIDVYEEHMEGKSYKIWKLKDHSFYETNFFGPITLREGEFFMMGDNRDMSKDSRFSDVGTINKSLLVGKGGMIFFSINGSFLQVWKWFTEIRFNRIFNIIR